MPSSTSSKTEFKVIPSNLTGQLYFLHNKSCLFVRINSMFYKGWYMLTSETGQDAKTSITGTANRMSDKERVLSEV